MIDMNKKYKTRSGLPVRILCVDRKNEFSVVYLVLNEQQEHVSTATINGKYTKTGIEEAAWDLIEISPYEDFKVDDLCVVWSAASSRKIFQYFAHSDGESAACFLSGTSYNDPKVYAWWDNCRKATPEEIATKTIKD